MRSLARTSQLRCAFVLAAVGACATASTPGLLAQEAATSPPDVSRLESLVRGLRDRLSLDAPVAVSIVPSDARMMSVRASVGLPGSFDLSVDADFLGRLTEAEIEAAIAHELGHVWVFTHHPYLQTEQLANQIAMRAVTRERLEQVYEKVWKGGTKGDLGRFLGPPSVTAPAAAHLQ